ncbi:Cof-type HAD-IIB family hydrolase [uncultured Fibrobacter sp.]|uniref:Cof-type HAD-IIB family hydrolase n=1 Tax=uncultured Fibrobacter sp. TaxID=261512 RepID=UPI00262C7FE6|nr:Cof-type HAD-IIB family hydrolase [uncultured Fibrobacter sp.]
MKLLFTDLDGTLLTDDKQILDVDMSAISKMLEEGHKLVLCTGRPLTSAKMLAKRYGFDRPGFFLVSFNGGLIYDYATEKSILTRRISVDDVKFIMDRAHECGMHAHTYAGDLVVSEHETEQLKTYCRIMQMDYLVVNDIREYFGSEGVTSGLAPNVPINVVVKPPIKVNIITPFDHGSLVDFRAEMRKTTAGKLFDVFSKPEMLEFSHLKSNKGDAVRFMADFYKVPLSSTIAVGDEENDCPMIEAAGVGVAMSNASEVAKKVANYVTVADNNHGGIAEVIQKFVF